MKLPWFVAPMAAVIPGSNRHSRADAAKVSSMVLTSSSSIWPIPIAMAFLSAP